MKKRLSLLLSILLTILILGLSISMWHLRKLSTDLTSRATMPTGSQILNRVFNATDDTLMVRASERGAVTSRAVFGTTAQILNDVYNASDTTLKVSVADFGDLTFKNFQNVSTTTLADYDFLQYDASLLKWKNIQTPTVANNTWILGRNAADSGNVNVFRVTTSDLIEAGTIVRLPNDTWLKWRNADDSADVTGFRIYSSTNIIDVGADMYLDDFSQGALNRWATSENVADEGSITTLAAINAPGFGIVTANDGAEYCVFIFSADGGTITLASNSANCVATDTDAKLCVIDSGGAGIHFKNRLGSTQTIKAWVQY